MNLNLINNEILKNDMTNHFNTRTNNHINHVKHFANILSHSFDHLGALNEIVKSHDLSKFKEPEYTPYLYITWKYKCKKDNVKFDIPDNIQNDMHQATTHHVLNNKHHPEYWCGLSDVISKSNRDSTHVKINAHSMPDIYIAEMICDWSAMSKEHNESNGPYQWANDNINNRWLFTDVQINNIYKYIDTLWKG